MALLSLTGEDQWWSDTNGWFQQDLVRGFLPRITCSVQGAPAAGNVVTLKWRHIGSPEEHTYLTLDSSYVPFSIEEEFKPGLEWDVGVAAGDWVGGTLSVELS